MAPGSMGEAWRAWEPMLLERRYGLAFFDGLNRFYVAEEEAGLAERFPREPTPWGAVRHLHEFGRAPDDPEHPDHALAHWLVRGFLAALPRLDRDVLASLSGDSVERDAMETDAFRAALGRIAAAYDGGQIMED
jgi:hypothetical protein